MLFLAVGMQGQSSTSIVRHLFSHSMTLFAYNPSIEQALGKDQKNVEPWFNYVLPAAQDIKHLKSYFRVRNKEESLLFR